jgi:hypothetical protein
MGLSFTRGAEADVRMLADRSRRNIERLLSAALTVTVAPNRLPHMATRLTDDMFLLRSGDVQALLIVDPHVPGDLVVAGVYRASDDLWLDITKAANSNDPPFTSPAGG